MNQYSAVYEDAVNSILELLETDKRFTYIAQVQTGLARIDYPDWSNKEFNDAVARLITY